MDFIFGWIGGLNSFLQGLLGSGVFALSSWLAQRLYKKAQSTGSEFWEAYTTLDIYKHVLHRHYVRSTNIQMVSYGSSIALLNSARWALLAVLVLIFSFGVNSALEGNWLYVLGSWFAFNCMLEARSWVKDSSDPNSISHIPQEKVEAVTKLLFSRKNTGVEDIKNS